MSAAVGRGEKMVFSVEIAPWIVLLHGGGGLLAMWMAMKAVA